jgi:hypothetical protein
MKRVAPMKQFVTEQSEEFENRIHSAQLKLLDAIEATIEKLAPKPEPVPEPVNPPIPVFRRLVANKIALWKWCPQNRCRRSHCCRGEPLHCLCIVFPLLPPDSSLFQMLKKGERVHSPRRNRKQVDDVLAESMTKLNSPMKSPARTLPRI